MWLFQMIYCNNGASVIYSRHLIDICYDRCVGLNLVSFPAYEIGYMMVSTL